MGQPNGNCTITSYKIDSNFFRKENNISLKNPDVTLFMIIELVSSTCFNSILYSEPLPIDEYKPILYDTIKKLINTN